MGLRIGLTGGIASGKSLIAKLFSAHGVDVHDTDIIARELVEPGSPALQQIIDEFGRGILTPEGSLDRQSLRDVVFADAERRRRLEAILHPAIGEELLARAQRSAGLYQIFVVPLLIESGMDRLCDRVLSVDCPPEVQIKRLMARDGESEAGARRILAAQAPRETRNASAHDLLLNTSTPQHMQRQVALLDRFYRWRAVHP